MKRPFFLGSRKYIDKPFWILFIILIVVAIIALFSAGSTLAYKETGSILGPIAKQILFILIGVSAAYVVQLLPTKWIRIGGYIALAASFIFLAIMLIPHNKFVVSHNDAGRWFNLFGFQFQPSELAKLGLTIVVADLLSNIKTEEDTRKYFFWTLGITVALCFIIMLSNLSTAVLIALIVLCLWVLAHIPWKYIGITAAATIVLGVLFYVVVEFCFVRPKVPLPKPFDRAATQVGRIDDFIAEHKQTSEEFELNDDNYQRSYAKVAVMRGGKTPFGVLPGNSKERDVLPLAYADYIFAIIVEETGIVGAIGLIFLYLAILFRACTACSKYDDYAAMLMTMGLALMIAVQALISMAVSVGLGPVTGQPLPMISKGGTSVIITSLYFGIMMCVAREQNELKDKSQRTIDESMQQVPNIEDDMQEPLTINQ